MTVLGISDPGVWSAYLLCILSAIFCVIYGMLHWDKGDEEIHPEDIKWVKDEKQVEEEL